MGQDKGIYINIGSGQRPFRHPWLNYDVQVQKWKEFTEKQGCHWVDWMGEGRLFASGSVDMICLHHVIEHFGCNEADELIEECYQDLKEKGSLLVFVPNIRALVQRWLVHQLDTQLVMTNLYGAYMGDEADRHKWGYDITSLLGYLKRFGFHVKPFDWRKIEGADIAEDWWIAGVEGIKKEREHEE